MAKCSAHDARPEKPSWQGAPEGVGIGGTERAQSHIGDFDQCAAWTNGAVGIVHVAVIEPQVGQVSQANQGAAKGHDHRMRHTRLVDRRIESRPTTESPNPATAAQSPHGAMPAIALDQGEQAQQAREQHEDHLEIVTQRRASPVTAAPRSAPAAVRNGSRTPAIRSCRCDPGHVWWIEMGGMKTSFVIL